MGDFNWCGISKNLPNYKQYVDFATREENKLDLFFCSIRNSYRAYKFSRLGTSDHSLVFIAPEYKQKLKTQKVVEKQIKKWDSDTIERLQGCLECTDWSVFLTGRPSLDELTERVTDYQKFCEDMIVPVEKYKFFPNTKPWVTKLTDLRLKIKKKHKLRLSGNKLEMKELQEGLDSLIETCKGKYKDKLENQFNMNNTRAAWQGLKTITGYSTKSTSFEGDKTKELADDLNVFYARYEKETTSNDSEIVTDNHAPTEISVCEVQRVLKQVIERKSSGRDGLSCKILKVWHMELCDIFTHITQ